MAQLTDDQDLVLSILNDHGATRFKSARDLTACDFLCKHGYISDQGRDGLMSLAPKGLRYLNTH
jgi:hypothetical protein